MDEITLLYTHNLHGDIDLLPRLYSFLRRLRGDAHTLLLDLGGACTPDAWHCDITEGRSMLLVLDSMGYTAMNAADLSTEAYEKLARHISATLVTEDRPHVRGDLLFALEPTEGDGHLCVVMAPTSTITLQSGGVNTPGHTLYLAGLRAGQVGMVRLALRDGETPALRAFEVREMPVDSFPDPTIAGVVDFVLDEARYYGKRRSDTEG